MYKDELIREIALALSAITDGEHIETVITRLLYFNFDYAEDHVIDFLRDILHLTYQGSDE